MLVFAPEDDLGGYRPKSGQLGSYNTAGRRREDRSLPGKSMRGSVGRLLRHGITPSRV